MSYEQREHGGIVVIVTATLYENDYTQVNINVEPGIDPLVAVKAVAKISSALFLEAKAGLQKHATGPIQEKW